MAATGSPGQSSHESSRGRCSRTNTESSDCTRSSQVHKAAGGAVADDVISGAAAWLEEATSSAAAMAAAQKHHELLVFALCKTMFALPKSDSLNLGRSSVHEGISIMNVCGISRNQMQWRLSVSNPYATHSMLRIKHSTNIEHTLSSCLPETVDPLRLHGHQLQP